MELSEYLHIVRKYWKSLAMVVLISLATAAGASLLTKPSYTSSASVFVSVNIGSSASDLQQGSTYAENQVKSFAQIAAMPAVLDPVIAELGLDMTSSEFAKTVTSTVPGGTAIIQIELVAPTASGAAARANAVAKELTVVVGSLSPTTAVGVQPVVATVVAPATVPTEKTSPRVALNLSLGALAGVLLGVAQAVVRSRLDTTLAGPEEVRELTGRSLLGSVSDDKTSPGEPLVVFRNDLLSPRAEDYRRLRTNLQFLTLDSATRVVVITSAVSGEGKTTTAINLATTIAETGESVLLVDADLRRPSLARYLSLEPAAGLTTVLIGRASLAEVAQQIGVPGLDVLTSGEIPPNPSELLGSPAMRHFLGGAGNHYGTVIIDSPPLLPVTDAAILTAEADGALLVIGSGQVRSLQVMSAIDAIESGGGDLLGLVLNRLRQDDRHKYYYNYS